MELSDGFLHTLSCRAKEKPQTQRRKTTSLRRSTESARRPDALPHTQFALQVHLKGRAVLGVIKIKSDTIILFYQIRIVWNGPDCHCLFPGVLKMDTHLAGIICHVVSIFATNVLITTTEGNVDRTTTHITLKTFFFSSILYTSIYQNKVTSLGFVFLSTASHKDGYETFASWKKVWTSNGKSEPSLKAFMADQQLPYWVSASSVPASY